MSGAAAVIERFLERSQIPHKRLGEDRWAAQLAGERKLAIPVAIALRAGRLEIESFFLRKPLENAERLYEVLLRRNARAYGAHFALDAAGDVYLAGARAADGIDEDELDRIFGSLLVEADGLFDAAIEIGFASYLERDRRWRAAQ